MDLRSIGFLQSASAIANLVLFVNATSGAAVIPEPPRSPGNEVTVSLFASEPDIVTPIGATVDAHGRLLVVESQSHFRPKNYQGPPTDRIRLLEDITQCGHADRIRTFYEGTNTFMNLATSGVDGSIVVSSRNEIFRLSDMDGSGVAGDRVTLATLQTTADYPHNGLHGLTVDSAGNVYFAIGENRGTFWKLVGADGATLSDDTGCGAIFQVDARGHGLKRYARGLWNTFGLGFDPAGNLWAVDNDPDGRPPSRLLQVVPGGDYGYEYRYGRTGMHPLQAWDGELPGTLGMVSGVGEGPCAVQWHRDVLLVSSWRDHQIEAHAPTLRGASFVTSMRPLLVGGERFRPVAIAFASDKTMYLTDWGSASYAINGIGRVWKVTFNTNPPAQAAVLTSDATSGAARLRDSLDVAELTAALDDADPAISQAAQYGLARLTGAEKIDWNTLRSPRQRIALLACLLLRGTDLRPYVDAALKNPDDRVRQMAVRVVAEQGIVEAKDTIDEMLRSQPMSPRLLGMAIATRNQLNGDRSARIDSAKMQSVLLARINAPGATDQSRAVAMRMLQAGHARVPLSQVEPMLRSPHLPLQLEAASYLADDTDPSRLQILADLAADEKMDPAVRAEAVAGLSDDAAGRIDLLLKWATGDDAILRAEALRSLRTAAAALTAAQRDRLTSAGAAAHPSEADLATRLLGGPAPARPQESDLAGWEKVLDARPGDPAAGRRIFFHHAGPACYRCHVIESRGRAVGPDLTMIGGSRTRGQVLESILDPSREIAPLYSLWTITTQSGERIDGILLRREGQAVEVYVDASGREFKVPESKIVDRKLRQESLMPSGLAQGLTDQEFRDLLAFLLEKR